MRLECIIQLDNALTYSVSRRDIEIRTSLVK